MNIQKARTLIGKENANKKWAKYKTPEERRKLLSKAHEARRQKAKERRENKDVDKSALQ